MKKTLAILALALISLFASAPAQASHLRARVAHGRAIKRVKHNPAPVALPAEPSRPLGVLLPAREGMNFGAPQEAAYQVAAAYWGTPPNCYGVVREIAPLPGNEGGIGTLADTPTPAEECLLVITPAVAEGDPHMMCLVEVHEYGHLTGHDHVYDPTNIMYPLLDPSKISVPGC